MATSGSLTTTSYEGRYYKLAWERTSVDTANNKSTIKWTLSAHGGSSSWYAERTLTVVVAGKTVVSKTARVERKTGEIDSGTITISHNSDGTKSFSASIKAAVFTSDVNCSGSKTFTLTAIPRASTITASAANIGEVSKITIKRNVSSYTDTLTYSIDDGTGEGESATIVSKTSNTSVNWTVPTSAYNYIPNIKSVNVTITCTTYNGTTVVGTSKATFKAYVTEETSRPTINQTIIDTDSRTLNLTGSNTTFINGYSDAKITIGASALNGATLKSVSVINGSTTLTSDSTISNITSNKFVFKATDSRGFATQKTVLVNFIPYINPTCNLNYSGAAADGSVTLNLDGIFYNGSFSATNSNTVSFEYFYKEAGGSYGNSIPITNASINGNSYTASVKVSGLDYRKTYVFRAGITDRLCGRVLSQEITVRFLPIFDWGGDDFNFNVPVAITDDTRSYNLLGLARAMSTVYELPVTTSAGTNWTVTGAGAYLIGGSLRVNFGANRSSAVNGNIDNETVLTMTVKHDGKIGATYNMGFSSAGTGAACTFVTNATNDGTDLTIIINLAATATSTSSVGAYFTMPCRLDLDKF